jgi:flagellar motility protein MotE (MotC chaperone)
LKKIALIISLISIFANAENSYKDNESKVFQCNQIFEARKQELIDELSQIEEKQAAEEALLRSREELLNQKRKKLDEQEKRIQQKMGELKDNIESIDRKMSELKRLEEMLKKGKDNKLLNSYGKMKESKAAAIFDTMDAHKVAAIIFYLEDKKMGKILSKMQPAKAAAVTRIIHKGLPFTKEVNETNSGEIPKEIDDGIQADLDSAI